MPVEVEGEILYIRKNYPLGPDRITWDLKRYHELIEPLEAQGVLRHPIVPEGCQHNAHMYYVLLASEIDREKLLDKLRHNDIWAVFHYIPCTHRPPAGVLAGPMARWIRRTGYPNA